MDRLGRFLDLVHTAGGIRVPPAWSDELRKALADGLVRVGWGGGIEITDAGRDELRARSTLSK